VILVNAEVKPERGMDHHALGVGEVVKLLWRLK
jgi:hypothetical protein